MHQLFRNLTNNKHKKHCINDNALYHRLLKRSLFTSSAKISIAAGLIAGLTVLHFSTADAQEAPIINPGDAVVTGFSGTTVPEEDLLPAVFEIDETFIDLNGPVAQVVSVASGNGPPSGQLIGAPKLFSVSAGQVGQVFGIALDDGIRDDTPERIPNIYIVATSVHGLQIVIPDNDGDGRPERVQTGSANATFMDGQFGTAEGGTPGSIWKIDGLTGEVTLFADIQLDGVDNSGPGLGNIAFDRKNRQFFVSDLDTGMIHRLDINGNDLGTFDHGLFGRPNHGLDPVAFDPANRMDITNPAFDTEDSETWGYAKRERQVWGVAVHGDRLYYATSDGPQIWSVGINHDGSLEVEGRWELDFDAGPKDYPISDIAFDRKGFMYLAQRGEITSSYDYSEFAEPRKAKVVRYWRETPDDPATSSIWVEKPQEYAIGFPGNYRNTSGGIDLGYGYDSEGRIVPGACDATLWTTGDDLRNNPALAPDLAAGGPPDVNGLQGNNKDLTRPQNEPPFLSYFVDYDDKFGDSQNKGHVGDVEVWRPCEGQASWYEDYPYPGGELPEPEPVCFPGDPACDRPPLPPCLDIDYLEFYCKPTGWAAALDIRNKSGEPFDTLKANSLTPGITVSPPLQSVPGPGSPFQLDIDGALPSETFKVDVCAFRKDDAATGEPFRCCQARIPLEAPADICGP